MRDLNSSYFLPYRYKLVGWVIIGFSILTIAIIGIFYNNEFQNLGVFEHILVPIVSYAMMIGLAIVVSTREKKEDEMIRMIRLESFQYGLYLTVFLSLLFFLVSLVSIADKGMSAFSFIVAASRGNMVSGINATLVFIVAIYQFKLFRLRKDEE